MLVAASLSSSTLEQAAAHFGGLGHLEDRRAVIRMDQMHFHGSSLQILIRLPLPHTFGTRRSAFIFYLMLPILATVSVIP